MSTHSTIWIKTGDTYTGVYCHFDGYLDHNGAILLEHYNSAEKAQALISMGSILALNTTLENSEFFHRDRDEDLDIYLVDNITDTYEEAYSYVWMNDNWYTRYANLETYVLLSYAINPLKQE